MSLSDIASFGRKLLFLSERVAKNAEEIKALRQDLKALTEFTQDVAYAVRRHKDSSEAKSIILVKSLETKLLELENRLLRSNQMPGLNDESRPCPEIEPSDT